MYIEQKDGALLGMKELLPDAVKVDEETGDLKLLVSTEAEDSDGDVVYQRKSKGGEGWQLDRFNKAPVITWQHDLRVPNLSGPRTRAVVQTLKRNDADGTGAWGLFLNPLQFDEGDVFAMELDGKYRRDVLKESSVGFRIKADGWEPRRVEGRVVGKNIYTPILIEVAAVNRGANPETATLAKNMVSRFALDHEDAGSAEAKELAAELDNLRQLVTVLGNEIKLLGDKFDGQADRFEEEKAAATHAQELMKREENKAANELLALLKKIGTAHR